MPSIIRSGTHTAERHHFSSSSSTECIAMRSASRPCIAMCISLQALRLEQLDMTFKAIASGVEEIETIERQVNGYINISVEHIPCVHVQWCVCMLYAHDGRTFRMIAGERLERAASRHQGAGQLEPAQDEGGRGAAQGLGARPDAACGDRKGPGAALLRAPQPCFLATGR